MQTNHRRRRSGVKMTLDGLPHISLQFVECVCLGEDRIAQSMCFVSAFARLANRKDDLAIGHASNYIALSRNLLTPVLCSRILPDQRNRVMREHGIGSGDA